MSNEKKSVLFIEDDADVRRTAELLLQRRGFAFTGAETPQQALSRLAAATFNVILLDLNFGKAQTSGAEGLECLTEILRHDPDASVIVVTGHSGLNIAVKALRAGAKDFIMKPWNNERLMQSIEGVLSTRTKPVFPTEPDGILIGQSEAIKRAKATMDRCAPLTASMIIRGEPGTGKTLAAMSIHRQSGRQNMIVADAGLLAESDLPGQTDTTLLIENIERLGDAMSQKLLAWLALAARQNNRLITTTSRPMSDLGLDRGLVYAISTLDIEMPPLRSRPDDVVILAEHFLRMTCQIHGLRDKAISPKAQSLLQAQAWPDNIHTLRRIIERTAILFDADWIGPDDLVMETAAGSEAVSAADQLAATEKNLIEDALKRSNFNVSAAAEELGLTRPALYRRMSKYGL